MYFNGDISFKGITSGSLGVIVSSMPKVQHSSIKATEYDIPFRDGIQYSSWRNRTDAQITVQFAILKNNNRDFIQTLRATRQWLDGSGVLILDNNPDVYYNVKKVEITNEDMYTLASGELEATFVVEPFEYMIEDTEIEQTLTTQDVSLSITNDGDLCKPLIINTPYEGEPIGPTRGVIIRVDNNDSARIESINNVLSIYCDTNLMYTYGGLNNYSTPLESAFKNHNYEDLWIPNGNHIITLKGFSSEYESKVIIKLRKGYAI